MNRNLAQLLTSKKFIASIAGVFITVGSHYGLDLPTEQVELIVQSLMAYVLAQGVADFGKHQKGNS